MAAPRAAAASDGAQREVGLLTDLWRTRCWRLFPLLTTYVVCLTLLTPIKPNLMTDFFASRGASHPIRCEHYTPKHEPQACRDAHSAAVTYSSWSDFVSNTFLLFLLAPQVGRWSDAHGRRPFLMLCFLCASATVLVLFLNLHYGVSLYFYFLAQAVNGAFSSLSICIAYLADLLQPHNRAPAFGMVLCSYSLGILVGPLGGGYLPPATASAIALAGMLGCIGYIALLVPESTSARSRAEARKKQSADPPALAKPWQGLAILGRSRLFAKLTAVVMILGVVSQGLYELLMQYFQITLSFTAADQAHMFVLAGLAGTLTQLLLLRLLLRFVGKLRMLLVGIVCSIVEMALLSYVWSKPVALTAVCIGAVGNLTFPAISAIKSLHVPESEQGAVQGALQGARALAQGAGPLIFAGLFALFTQSWSPLPYFPGAPFACGALLLLVGLLVALTIDGDSAEGGLGSGEAAEPLLQPEEPDEEAPAAAAKGPNLGPCLPHQGEAMLLDQTPELAIAALAGTDSRSQPAADASGAGSSSSGGGASAS